MEKHKQMILKKTHNQLKITRASLRSVSVTDYFEVLFGKNVNKQRINIYIERIKKQKTNRVHFACASIQ